MRNWRTMMKKILIRSSPDSLRISKTSRERLVFLMAMASVSLKTEEVILSGISISIASFVTGAPAR